MLKAELSALRFKRTQAVKVVPPFDLISSDSDETTDVFRDSRLIAKISHDLDHLYFFTRCALHNIWGREPCIQVGRTIPRCDVKPWWSRYITFELVAKTFATKQRVITMEKCPSTAVASAQELSIDIYLLDNPSTAFRSAHQGKAAYKENSALPTSKNSTITE